MPLDDLREYAVKGIEQELEDLGKEREKLDAREEVLQRALQSIKGEPMKDAPRRVMSAEARALISAAQKKRWAKQKSLTNANSKRKK